MPDAEESAEAGLRSDPGQATSALLDAPNRAIIEALQRDGQGNEQIQPANLIFVTAFALSNVRLLRPSADVSSACGNRGSCRLWRSPTPCSSASPVRP